MSRRRWSPNPSSPSDSRAPCPILGNMRRKLRVRGGSRRILRAAMPVLQLVEGGKRRASRSAGLLDTIDLLVEGTNLTARVAEVELCPLLYDLGAAFSQLALAKATRRSIRCFGSDGSWEIGLERAGEQVLVSLFRSGPDPEVAVFEREVALTSLIEATLGAMARTQSDPEHALDARALALAEVELQKSAILEAPRPL